MSETITLTANNRIVNKTMINTINSKPSSINNNNIDNNNVVNIKKVDCTIEEFFRHKNVFVTGATGFLGTVLIEALLSVSPNIGKIYVLVREKYGSDPKVRISRLLSKPLFAQHSAETLEKVVPVVGELSEPNLGLSDEKYQELRKNINIIYHSAATINFNTQLRSAIKINVIGTLRTLELAKSLDNLVSYIYLSTAFCNCNNQGLIKEQVYPSYYDPREMIKKAEDESAYLPERNDPNLSSFLKNHPNTYTLTKQLAENLIGKEMVGYPAGIVRPSVIYGTYQYPVEGWNGNANSGHLGFLAGYMKGIFRTVCGNADTILDIIPCDYVVNSAITMGWYIGTHEINEPEVIHCTSGQQNPLTYRNLCKYMNENVQKHPADLLVWKPYAKIRNSWRYTICFYLFHVLPALFFWLPETLFKIGKPQHSSLEYMRVYHKGNKAFDFFLNQNFRYELKNSLRVLLAMRDEDQTRYSFDSKTCDWSLMMERSFKGLRHYYFRESKETTFKHTIIWFIYEVLYYGTFGLYFLVVTMLCANIMPIEFAVTIALATLSLLIWL